MSAAPAVHAPPPPELPLLLLPLLLPPLLLPPEPLLPPPELPPPELPPPELLPLPELLPELPQPTVVTREPTTKPARPRERSEIFMINPPSKGLGNSAAGAARGER
jgi:hypothetical protein